MLHCFTSLSLHLSVCSACGATASLSCTAAGCAATQCWRACASADLRQVCMCASSEPAFQVTPESRSHNKPHQCDMCRRQPQAGRTMLRLRKALCRRQMGTQRFQTALQMLRTCRWLSLQKSCLHHRCAQCRPLQAADLQQICCSAVLLARMGSAQCSYWVSTWNLQACYSCSVEA